MGRRRKRWAIDREALNWGLSAFVGGLWLISVTAVCSLALSGA